MNFTCSFWVRWKEGVANSSTHPIKRISIIMWAMQEINQEIRPFRFSDLSDIRHRIINRRLLLLNQVVIVPDQIKRSV